MADCVAVAHLDQLPPGRGMTVTVRGFAVALFKVAGTVYSMAEPCRHPGRAWGPGAQWRGACTRWPIPVAMAGGPWGQANCAARSCAVLPMAGGTMSTGF